MTPGRPGGKRRIATVAMRGSATYTLYVIGKFGLRALSQSLARAHAKDGVANSYWWVHLQPRSAWSNEIELRPYTEECTP